MYWPFGFLKAQFTFAIPYLYIYKIEATFHEEDTNILWKFKYKNEYKA